MAAVEDQQVVHRLPVAQVFQDSETMAAILARRH
jgi:hypothetical protein